MSAAEKTIHVIPTQCCGSTQWWLTSRSLVVSVPNSSFRQLPFWTGRLPTAGSLVEKEAQGDALHLQPAKSLGSWWVEGNLKGRLLRSCKEENGAVQEWSIFYLRLCECFLRLKPWCDFFLPKRLFQLWLPRNLEGFIPECDEHTALVEEVAG